MRLKAGTTFTTSMPNFTFWHQKNEKVCVFIYLVNVYTSFPGKLHKICHLKFQRQQNAPMLTCFSFQVDVFLSVTVITN